TGEIMRIKAVNRAGKTGVIAAGIGALALTAAACASSAPASGANPTHHPMASHSAAAASATFGSDCEMVPASGMGSMHAMMTDPVVTAAAHNPLLTTLAADIKTAGLTSTLNSMGSITVFAPENSAFTSLPHSDMTMMHNAAELAKILKYHVVSGRVTTAELASAKPLTTLEGSTLNPSKMGSVYEVNNAGVICGNIQTANATVYIINKVLIPRH
ncbi:MAG: fasciclin domain-containing protein, partial [Streptosporangiaceae bacterium]